jgi:signal transduction histidine kinase/CheY-like chemotaxis protein
MKLVPAIMAVPFLIVLLTWLAVRAVDANAERFDLALGEIDNFERVEAGLDRDVLSARIGVLRNYDPLVRETRALDASIARLRRIPGLNDDTTTAIEDLANMVARQEDLVEQFKSDNALLQNSLAYFALFSSDWKGPFAGSVSTLATAMLRFTLDTSAVSARTVQDRLDELSQQASLSGGDETAKVLLAHTRLLLHLLPTTYGALMALRALPQVEDPEVLRTMVLQQQTASRKTARMFRFLLYVSSLLLVGLLVKAGWQLHVRSRALHRHAALEHVLTGISMRFVEARAHDIEAAIEQALADMAQCVGAERAYFLLSGPSPRSFLWNGPGRGFGPGWPDQAFVLMRRCEPAIDGVVSVPDVRRLSAGMEREILTAVGVRGWACSSRGEAGATNVLLGFDAVTHPWCITPSNELRLLRMALDTIANAFYRQSFEREKERLELRLHHARRLETVGTLASGIAHNFNNIVGAILGYTEMADEQQRQPGILTEIRRAGERARELVDQILIFARRRDLHRSAISVNALISEVTSLLGASLPSTIELIVSGPPDETVVFGVHAQLQQVILNLCNNAAQAMDNVGRIELEITVHEIAARRPVSHGSLSPGRAVLIAVSDTGRGIDKAVLEQIFDPFFTTRVTGSGLGLTTSRAIVSEHGGAIDVRSTVGMGSTFEVWLPVAKGAPRLTEAIPRGHGETVLIIEDDPERLLRDEEIIAALGYEPVGSVGGTDGQALCDNSLARFDAVVISHRTSATTALDLARAIHEIAPHLPILLATSSAADLGANALVAAGISDVIGWPISSTEMATALQDCLRRKEHQEAALLS